MLTQKQVPYCKDCCLPDDADFVLESGDNSGSPAMLAGLLARSGLDWYTVGDGADISVISGWLMLRPDEGPLLNCEVSTREPWMASPREVGVGCAYAITKMCTKKELIKTRRA